MVMMCDSITTLSGETLTFPNVNNVVDLTSSYTDIAGSIIEYEPPVGTQFVEYEFSFALARQDASDDVYPTGDFEFFIGDGENLKVLPRLLNQD